jgi:hypothetical protein
MQLNLWEVPISGKEGDIYVRGGYVKGKGVRFGEEGCPVGKGVPLGGVSHPAGCWALPWIRGCVFVLCWNGRKDFYTITHNPQEAIRYRGWYCVPERKFVDDAYDGRCIPWTMRPLDDASLTMSRGTGPHTEAGFWDENQTKVSRVFLFAFHIFALRFVFLQTYVKLL